MRKTERYARTVAWFTEHMPVAETELHFDSTFQLKNTYVINKIINESINPHIQERFDFYSSNSNSTFVVPDGDDVLVAAYYEREAMITNATGKVPKYMSADILVLKLDNKPSSCSETSIIQ